MAFEIMFEKARPIAFLRTGKVGISSFTGVSMMFLAFFTFKKATYEMADVL